MRTLVVHTGGIGDFLLTCPSILRLAEESPVELAGNPNRLALAAGHVDAIHDLSRVDFESVFTDPSTTLRDFLARFDRIVVWMRDGGAIQQSIRNCGVTDVRVFPGLPPRDWSEHASRYYLRCLGMTGAPALRLHVEPSPTQHDVIIHPGSGSPNKNWPLERFVALANALESRGRTITWCFGPAEQGASVANAPRTIRCDSLTAVARELGATRCYIGNDSGITHLAAAAGCATVAIFGPTDPNVWAPLGEQVAVVQGDPWPETDQVMQATLET